MTGTADGSGRKQVPPATGPSLVRLIAPAGISALAIGTIMAIAGILVAPLFLPGTWVITASFVLLAAAGVAGAVSPGESG